MAAIGLAAFWLTGGSGRTPRTPAANLLADTLFFHPPDHYLETSARVPHPDNFFSRLLEATIAESWRKRHLSVPVDPSMTVVEHGNPEEVRSKIKKTIRENALEEMITRFSRTTKEV